MMMEQSDRNMATIEKIRAFNRFYLPAMDLLSNYLGSEFSVAESRVLYEVYTHERCTATQVARSLNLDKGYLSRILKKHEQSGFLVRTTSKADARERTLLLTDAGTERTQLFIAASNRQIGGIIAPLSAYDCATLCAALDAVTEILSKCTAHDQAAA